MRPSTPGSAKSGAAAPISSVFNPGGSARLAPASSHPTTTPTRTLVTRPPTERLLGRLLPFDFLFAGGLFRETPGRIVARGGRTVKRKPERDKDRAGSSRPLLGG